MPRNDYLKTPFQTESQYIIEAIVSDLAEQIYYATNHQLPDSRFFAVTATEKPDSPRDPPVYELQIHLDANTNRLDLELNVNGPIWLPELYAGVGTALLLGAFALRDHAGYFFDLRQPLCRLTAHLAMAHFLGEAGLMGSMAGVILPLKAGESVSELRLRTVARPERLVAELLRRLGLQLPEQSRIIQDAVANVVQKTGV